MTDRPAPPPAPARADELIEFPSAFPIKVMGLNTDGFVHTMTQIAHKHDPFFDASTVELRDSSSGKYLSVTLTVTATSRQQLDDLYRELSGHPLAKYVI
ncbi:MAG: DUF493 domain-containing protein [Comamonas sp.]